MKTKYVYCIFYVERKFFLSINDELTSKGYKHIKAIVPTVKILKKTVRSRQVYEEVPILFNYGFMRMKSNLAFKRDFLNKLKREIQGIRGWLKSNESLHTKKKKKARVENAEDWDDFSIVAVCKKSEVRRFQRMSKLNKQFSMDDLNIQKGDYLVLRGYPYEGVDATVISVDYNNKTVKLLLYPESGKMILTLPFDNVIHSVYQNCDPDILLVDRAEMLEKQNLTPEMVEDILISKQY